MFYGKGWGERKSRLGSGGLIISSGVKHYMFYGDREKKEGRLRL